MRNRFDAQLECLGTELSDMGAMIESAIAGSVKALMERDTDAAARIVGMDEEIDDKEKEIESICMKLLLQQQPVAKDLRMISSALKMITDMERIGDQAADIAELTIHLSKVSVADWPDQIADMARATIVMVRDSIDAYVRRDLELCRQVIESDDVVDRLFDAVRFELIHRIQASPNTAEQSLDLLMVSKYFERIGDHATNIAEWVEFSITGTHKTQQKEQ